jgi:hypothetical protein
MTKLAVPALFYIHPYVSSITPALNIVHDSDEHLPR